MLGSGVLCLFCYIMASFSANPAAGLVGCILCGFSVGIMCREPSALLLKKFQQAEPRCLRSLPWPAIWAGHWAGLVGAVTQNAGDDLQAGMLVGCIFPMLC